MKQFRNDCKYVKLVKLTCNVAISMMLMNFPVTAMSAAKGNVLMRNDHLPRDFSPLQRITNTAAQVSVKNDANC